MIWAAIHSELLDDNSFICTAYLIRLEYKLIQTYSQSNRISDVNLINYNLGLTCKIFCIYEVLFVNIMYLCICQWNQPVHVYILTCVLNVGELQQLRSVWASATQSLTRGNVESREELVPTPRRRAFGWSNTNTAALRKERSKTPHRPSNIAGLHSHEHKHTLITFSGSFFESNYCSELISKITGWAYVNTVFQLHFVWG